MSSQRMRDWRLSLWAAGRAGTRARLPRSQREESAQNSREFCAYLPKNGFPAPWQSYKHCWNHPQGLGQHQQQAGSAPHWKKSERQKVSKAGKAKEVETQILKHVWGLELLLLMWVVQGKEGKLCQCKRQGKLWNWLAEWLWSSYLTPLLRLGFHNHKIQNYLFRNYLLNSYNSVVITVLLCNGLQPHRTYGLLGISRISMKL